VQIPAVFTTSYRQEPQWLRTGPVQELQQSESSSSTQELKRCGPVPVQEQLGTIAGQDELLEAVSGQEKNKQLRTCFVLVEKGKQCGSKSKQAVEQLISLPGTEGQLSETVTVWDVLKLANTEDAATSGDAVALPIGRTSGGALAAVNILIRKPLRYLHHMDVSCLFHHTNPPPPPGVKPILADYLPRNSVFSVFCIRNIFYTDKNILGSTHSRILGIPRMRIQIFRDSRDTTTRNSQDKV
jgi:hypothetical protein